MREPIDPRWVREIRKTLFPRHKISTVVYERSTPICEMFKEIEPQPLGLIDVEVARDVAKKEREESGFPIFLTALDMSKPGEPEYSEKVYGWTAKVKYKDEVEKFVKIVESMENRYKELRSKIYEKLIKEAEEYKPKPSLVEQLLKSS